MSDFDPKPFYFLAGAIVVFGVLFSLHLVQRAKLREKQALRPAATTAPEPAQAAALAEAQTRNAIQKLLAIPFFGGWLATGIGLLLPLVVFFACEPAALKDSRFELLLLALTILVWNLALTRFAQVRLTTPLLPIPLSFVAFLFCLLGVWEAFTGS